MGNGELTHWRRECASVFLMQVIYTERDSKIGNSARSRPGFEPGCAGAEGAQLE